MRLLGKKKKDDDKDQSSSDDQLNLGVDSVADSSDNIDLSDAESDDGSSDDMLSLGLDLSNLGDNEDAESEGEANKESEDDPFGGALMDIFSEAEESDSDLGPLLEYLEDIEMASLLVQAKELVRRFKASN